MLYVDWSKKRRMKKKKKRKKKEKKKKEERFVRTALFRQTLRLEQFRCLTGILIWFYSSLIPLNSAWFFIFYSGVRRKKNHTMCLFIGRWASVVWWKWEDECQKVGQILFSVKQAWVRVGFFFRNWSWQHVNQHSFSWEGWERLFKVVSSFHAWLLATLLVPFHCIIFIHAVLN